MAFLAPPRIMPRVGGHMEEAQHLYRDAIELVRHSGGPQQKMSDGCAFLWRSELAGHPRNQSAWRVMYDYPSQLPDLGLCGRGVAAAGQWARRLARHPGACR